MKAVKLMAVFFLSILLTGCWGSHETDELAYAMVVGFDKGPGKDIIVTFQIAKPMQTAGTATGGGNGSSQNKPFLNVSIIQRLPIMAFNLANVERSRELSMLHVAAFIFSEELARTGIKDYILPLNRFRETRGTALVLVCKGKAKDFLEKHQPKLEASSAKLYQHLVMINRIHGLSVTSQYSKFYSDIKSNSIQPTAAMTAMGQKDAEQGNPKVDKLGEFVAGELPSDKDEAQFLGTAVFRGDKMVGELTGDETRYLNILSGNLFQSAIPVEDPQRKGMAVGLVLRQARRPEIKIDLSQEKPIIDVEVFIEPDIVGVASGIHYESTELKPILEKSTKELIEKRCRELVAKTQNTFQSDIFGFGKTAKKQFLTIKEWQAYNWSEVYPAAEVNIKANVRIRRTGLMLKTAPVNE